MKHHLAVIVPCLACLPSMGNAWANSAKEPYTEMRITQFKQYETDKQRASRHNALTGSARTKAIAREKLLLAFGTDDFFKDKTAQTCPPPDPKPGIRAAPLVAAFAGIIVDWLFTGARNGISKRVKQRIKEHTLVHKSRREFGDMFDTDRWNNGESCVVMQLLHCTADPTAINSGQARCDARTAEVGMSVGLHLKQDGRVLRVRTYAAQVEALAGEFPRHSGGDVAISASFRIDAFGWSRDGSGHAWDSGDAVVASLDCAVFEDRKIQKDAASCRFEPKVPEGPEADPWRTAALLPMPPKTQHALVFEVVQVGVPSQGLKRFDAFFDATGESMSAALADAFKKKAKLAKDE
ncbi:MAG TPA: hypothetical protein PK743_11605 [Luteimonas sp.]|mgnify:CR=1 FL=1|nr:hypothetical protein [Luteimonas sp.]HRO26311.1 hypothetical protein [Luteimonas sp.]HRP73267.1 hypothetical protein [Luteimonas sp.]